MNKFILLAATTLLLTYVSPSMASSNAALCGNISGQSMSMAKAKLRFTEQGYDVRRVKREDGCLEVYAIDKQGTRVEIYLHPISGKIVKIKKKS